MALLNNGSGISCEYGTPQPRMVKQQNNQSIVPHQKPGRHQNVHLMPLDLKEGCRFTSCLRQGDLFAQPV
jgi:hypothetical protein